MFNLENTDCIFVDFFDFFLIFFFTNLDIIFNEFKIFQSESLP
jgi:hypothetical protein